MSEDLIAGMREAPAAFANAWAHAPARVTYRGREYERDRARTPEERVWYLAAAGLSDADAVLRMSPAHRAFDANGEGHYFLDADPSELNAARAEAAQARAAVVALQRKISTFLGEQKKWEAEKKKKWLIDIPGQIVTAGKVDWYKDQVEQMRLQLADLKTAEDAARAAADAAQVALNDANRRIRQEEERARQEQLRQQLQEEAAARAAQEAAARDAYAQASTSDYWSMTASPYGSFPGTDATLSFAQGGAWDPFAITAGSAEDLVAGGAGTVEGYGLDMQGVDFVDTAGGGDLEAARDQLRQEGRDLPGVTRHPSPYCFDRYYDGAEPGYLEAMFGWSRVAGSPVGALGADSPMMSGPARSQPDGGGDGFGKVAAVLGAILQRAPEILEELRTAGPPPSSGGIPPGAHAGEAVTRSVLEATGINKILDEKAAAAADRAGAKAAGGITSGAALLAVAVLLGALVLAD